jgi:hypothetical protein
MDYTSFAGGLNCDPVAAVVVSILETCNEVVSALDDNHPRDQRPLRDGGASARGFWCALIGCPGHGVFGFDADQLEAQCVDALEEPVEM